MSKFSGKHDLYDIISSCDPNPTKLYNNEHSPLIYDFEKGFEVFYKKTRGTIQKYLNDGAVEIIQFEKPSDLEKYFSYSAALYSSSESSIFCILASDSEVFRK